MERLTIEYCGEYVPKVLCSIDRFGEVDDCDSCNVYCETVVEDCNECAINKCFNKLGKYEDLEEQCIKENTWGLKILLKKWKEFFEDIQELYEYRKLKKQGRLPELPCKPGDRIYYIVRGGRKDIIESTKVIQIIIKDSIKIQCEKGVTLKPSQVFLTYKVAEQALKEQEEKNNEEEY